MREKVIHKVRILITRHRSNPLEIQMLKSRIFGAAAPSQFDSPLGDDLTFAAFDYATLILSTRKH